MNGDTAAPLYKYLKSSKGGLFGDSIKWNFSKFLVDKDGNVVERYAPTTSPLSIEVRRPFFIKSQHFEILHTDTVSSLLLLISVEGYPEAVECMNHCWNQQTLKNKLL